MTINPLYASMAMDRAQETSLQQANVSSPDSAKIKKTAQEFEAILIEQMFKEMKKTVKQSGFMGEASTAYDIFDGMLATEYSKSASAAGGLGLAKMIEDSLMPKPNKKFYE